MKTINKFIILLFLFESQYLAATAWDDAVKIFSENAELSPYRMEVISRTYNGRGELEKNEEQIFRLIYDLEGVAEQQLINAIEDGKDITEKKRKELQKDSEGRRGGPSGDMEGMDRHPLDPENQQYVTASDSGRNEYKDGNLCAIWDLSLIHI